MISYGNTSKGRGQDHAGPEVELKIGLKEVVFNSLNNRHFQLLLNTIDGQQIDTSLHYGHIILPKESHCHKRKLSLSRPVAARVFTRGGKPGDKKKFVNEEFWTRLRYLFFDLSARFIYCCLLNTMNIWIILLLFCCRERCQKFLIWKSFQRIQRRCVFAQTSLLLVLWIGQLGIVDIASTTGKKKFKRTCVISSYHNRPPTAPPRVYCSKFSLPLQIFI